MSKDSVASHKKFKAQQKIPFALLSDPNGLVCEEYGVLKEKSMFGKKYKGIERSTFVIDETGKIAALYRAAKVEGHIRELIDALSL